MQLDRRFNGVRFPGAVVNGAIGILGQLTNGDRKEFKPDFMSLKVTRDQESWTLDNLDEWFAEHDRPHADSTISMHAGKYRLTVMEIGETTLVSATAPGRGEVEAIVRAFSSVAEQHKLPLPAARPKPPGPPIVVFIGHGHSTDWRKVKDQLQDSHGYKVEAYEVGERAGHSIRDVLDSMLKVSSFAILMMTGEDESADGEVRARQNVVHEAGLFQGRLGFNRAIAVVEDGVEVFSNLNGVDQIRYPKGHVESAVAKILATLRREFGDLR